MLFAVIVKRRWFEPKTRRERLQRGASRNQIVDPGALRMQARFARALSMAQPPGILHHGLNRPSPTPPLGRSLATEPQARAPTAKWSVGDSDNTQGQASVASFAVGIG